MKEEREMHASTAKLYSKTIFKVYSDLRYKGKIAHTQQEGGKGYEKGESLRRGEISKYHMNIGS
jgi:hypothetical protein